jgi:beta-glucosidase
VTHPADFRQTTDGPNGARGQVFTGGTRAACFPAAVCSAATWNPELSRRIGNALAEETKTKSARVLYVNPPCTRALMLITVRLAPTMCNHRHPLGGRNFESFSEDPYLTGTMATSVVKGIQEKGIAATVKHFVANEQETDRLKVDEIISERALREIYLKPFEMVIKEAKPLAIMTAYNKINGCHADSHQFLLKQVLRGEWGWNGLVMSDWGGTNSTADSLNAGLDLEMPGPSRWRTVEAVLDCVKHGEVSEETITERARNVLNLVEKVGGFDNPEIPPEQSIVNPAHSQLIREVGGEGITLLKNEGGLLPLTKEKVNGKTIGLFGLAREALIHGGGSASLNAHYRVTPEEGLKAAYGDSVSFKFAKGAHTYRLLPPLASNCKDSQGNSGWTMEFFEQSQTNRPVKTVHGIKASTFSPILDNEAKNKEVKLTTTFTPSETGSHYLGCSGIGPTVITVNDKVVFTQTHNSPDPMGFMFGGNPEEEFTVPFTCGESYKIQIHTKPPTTNRGGDILAGLPGFRMGFMSQSEHDHDLLSEATALARTVDIALVFTGHTPAWETEGQDQVSFHLPRAGSQDALISAVATANPRTVVVNSTGVPIAMPWLHQVPALIQAWFPGQEAGNALADILTGAVNPSGRLPVSFPAHIADAPAHAHFPGSVVGDDDDDDDDDSGSGKRQRTVRYAEGVFVGYRHYDRCASTALLFPFGFGLSYSTFALSDARVVPVTTTPSNDENDTAFTASIDVTNTSATPGATVVQIYAGAGTTSTPTARTDNEDPVKVLVGFRKVALSPGEKKRVEVRVQRADMARWDEATKGWVVKGGRWDVAFGQSVRAEVVVGVDVRGSREGG